MINLEASRHLTAVALDHATAKGLKPIAVAVLDARGALKYFAAQDGVSLKRGDVASAKAHGALALGMGSRSLFKRVKEQPFFITAVSPIVGGIVPVPGGVLIRHNGEIVGAVGISGDTSDNDEAAACAGIVAAGFTPDPGSD